MYQSQEVDIEETMFGRENYRNPEKGPEMAARPVQGTENNTKDKKRGSEKKEDDRSARMRSGRTSCVDFGPFPKILKAKRFAL